MKTQQSRGLAAGAVAFLCLLLSAAPVPARAEPTAARAAVEATVGRVLEILAENEWPPEKRVSEIESVAYERFDFETISRLVLARNYRKFSEPQRDEFVAEFKRYLSRSYSNRVDRYEQERVEFVGERKEPRGDVTVRTRILGGQADGFGVDYRVRERDGQWLVIDVVIEGVSLIANYRSQFKEVVSQGGPQGLLDRLRAKNALGESDAS